MHDQRVVAHLMVVARDETRAASDRIAALEALISQANACYFVSGTMVLGRHPDSLKTLIAVGSFSHSVATLGRNERPPDSGERILGFFREVSREARDGRVRSWAQGAYEGVERMWRLPATRC
jgi:hypothetical protein